MGGGKRRGPLFFGEKSTQKKGGGQVCWVVLSGVDEEDGTIWKGCGVMR